VAERFILQLSFVLLDWKVAAVSVCVYRAVSVLLFVCLFESFANVYCVCFFFVFNAEIVCQSPSVRTVTYCA